MAFSSILYPERHDGARETAEQPSCFADLNLDQIVEAIAAPKTEYDPGPFFHTPLTDPDAVHYRQEVFRDLEHDGLSRSISSFAKGMRTMREHLAQSGKLHYRYQAEIWLLDATAIYCDAVTVLAGELGKHGSNSRGLKAFHSYLSAYCKSADFTRIRADIAKLNSDLANIKYCMLIKGNEIRVRKHDGDSDYGAAVLETFEKFKRGAVKDYRVKFGEWVEMNHIEAAVLDMVAKLYPEVFSALDQFTAIHGVFLDDVIAAFDREVQFYFAFLDHISD